MTDNRYEKTSDQVLVAIRQIIRAIDLQSRQMQRRHGLTSPQIMILKEIIHFDGITAHEIGKRIHLSRATVAEILLRLENKKFIIRSRNAKDRRQVNITATELALTKMRDSPPLLHESFVYKFNGLQNWEKTQFLSVFQRTAEMMNAEHLDAAPLLISDPIIESDVPILDKKTTIKHEADS